MRKNIIIYFSIVVIATLWSCEGGTPQPIIEADQRNNALLDSDHLKEDAYFLSRYTYTLIVDNEMARIAIERALSDSLKNLAKRIIEENNIQLKQVGEIAAQNNIVLPEQLGPEALKKVKDLKEIRLNIFDHEYLEWAANHIDRSMVDLDAITEQTSGSTPIFQVAKNIATDMHAHKKSIDQLHEKIGYHYD